MAYICHCTTCRQQSSSAFGISVWFPRERFELVNGELSFWSSRADSGNTKLGAFCGQCGSRIYHAENHEDPVLSVKGGSLDRITEIEPVAHIWTRSALPWVDLTSGGLPCFPKEPPDFDDFIRRFQAARRS